MPCPLAFMALRRALRTRDAPVAFAGARTLRVPGGGTNPTQGPPRLRHATSGRTSPRPCALYGYGRDAIDSCQDAAAGLEPEGDQAVAGIPWASMNLHLEMELRDGRIP